MPLLPLGTQLGVGLLGPLGPWTHRCMAFLCCSDFLLAFQQNTSELRTREWLAESMSKLNRGFLFASGGREMEVHTLPRS